MKMSTVKQFIVEYSDVIATILVFTGAFVVTFFWYLSYVPVLPYGDDLTSMVSLIYRSLGELLLPQQEALGYRPVNIIPLYIQANIFGFDMFAHYVARVFLQSLITCLLYLKVKQITRHRFFSIIIAFLYVISNFSFYSLNQFIGMMELLCVLFTLLFISALYDIYHNDDIQHRNRGYLIALTVMALAIFTHERFIVLTIPLILTLFSTKRNYTNIKKLCFYIVVSCVPLILNYVVKMAAGIPFFRGTGGQMMTFDPGQGAFSNATRNFFIHVAYLFGVRPDMQQWLHGVLRSNIDQSINFIIIISSISLVVVFGAYVYLYIKHMKNSNVLYNSLLFAIICIVTIGVLFGSSSFTLHVEQRWVHAPYLVALFLFSYVIHMNWMYIDNLCAKIKKIWKVKTIICVLLYLVTTMSFSLYFRNYFSNFFFIQWGRNAQTIYDDILVPYRKLMPYTSTIVIDRHGLFINMYYHANYYLLRGVFGENYSDIDFIAVRSIDDVDLTELSRPLLLLQWDTRLRTFVPAINELTTNKVVDGDGWLYGGRIGEKATAFLFNAPHVNHLRVSGYMPVPITENSLTITVNNNESETIFITAGQSFEVAIEFDNIYDMIKVAFEASYTYDVGWAQLSVIVSEIDFY